MNVFGFTTLEHKQDFVKLVLPNVQENDFGKNGQLRISHPDHPSEGSWFRTFRQMKIAAERVLRTEIKIRRQMIDHIKAMNRRSLVK